MQTESVSPLVLQVGDLVHTHGAIVRVVDIKRRPCDIPRGIEVVSALCTLVGTNKGNIPDGYWDTLDGMHNRGVDVTGLRDGLYWTVQGNAHARFSRVIPNEPQFVMTKSAIVYAKELQGHAAIRYQVARNFVSHYNDDTAHGLTGDEDARTYAIALQRHAANTYQRFADVMGLWD